MDRVVVDTNVLLVSISNKSSLHWVFRRLVDRNYELIVTTDILAEYEEVIGRHMGHKVAEAVMAVLENLPNVMFVTSYFKFNLLNDPDDNKFVDCAIAGNANYIVTHDEDFNLLSEIDFPKVKVLKTHQFFKKLPDIK
ncbi:MAG: putative toxin-antitoxin system toxin component, PIN family [Chlorobi bacterium]|nr:putative toxin-antitoxin system toxin component, PIN family [Chlorobiota bacterium]